MTVLITLTLAGEDTGPFSLYSNIDGFTVPFETGVSKASLLAGYTSALVPDYTTIIRVKSGGDCVSYIDIILENTTTTTTTLFPPTTTTTTTLFPPTTTTTTTDPYTYYAVAIYVCGSCTPLGVNFIRSLASLTFGQYYNPGDGYIYRIQSTWPTPVSYVAEFGAVVNGVTCVISSGYGC